MSYIKKGLLIFFLCSFTLTALAKNTILILGDSLSSAHGIGVEQGWVWLLQQRLIKLYPGVHVVNASQSGDTTSNGLSRLSALLHENQPSIVLIELGANDGLRGLPIAVIRENLQKMIHLVLNEKAIPILIGIQLPPNFGLDYISKFQNIFKELASKNKIVFVASLLNDLENNNDNFQLDGLHPVASAQPIMLNNVWIILKPKLSIFDKTTTRGSVKNTIP